MIKVWAGPRSLQRLQGRGPLTLPRRRGPQAILGLWPYHPNLCAHLHKPSPLCGSVFQVSLSFLFQRHLSLDLGSTRIQDDLVQR